MIEISHICKKFGRLSVLDDVSVTLSQGQSIALIGPNGSGKTTLIRSLLGMVKPDKGSIRFNGQDILQGWAYRADMGYMPQIGRYPDNMTIGQVFKMMKEIRMAKEERWVVEANRDRGAGSCAKEGRSLDEELFHAFGLDGMTGKRMRTLSGGTRQKVSASLAFLFNPSVLILDEPTAGLDPVATGILKEKIQAVREEGRLILITSHILADLDDMVSEVVYLQEGRVKFHKTLSRLRADTGEEKLVRAIAQYMQITGSQQKSHL
ncbi:MAG TPA: ABC transporter ATP-binding protein [Puia sp.]|jgi:Cu-processing system ATP-binding protein|nr:ABC transporter ATP-binding protein [Puia sp.]